MFHKIKNVFPLPEYRLSVQFAVGCTKIYDVKPLFEQIPLFAQLKENHLFSDVTVDVGGHGIVWNDDLDLSCEELWENGVEVKTPFDGLMAFSDATNLWDLNESTLRKAISYGKLVEGIDVCKFGKQWVVSVKAMEREYGRISTMLANFIARPYDISIEGNVYKAQTISSTIYNISDEVLKDFLSNFTPIINTNRRAYVEMDFINDNLDSIMAEYGWKPLLTHDAYWKAC